MLAGKHHHMTRGDSCCCVESVPAQSACRGRPLWPTVLSLSASAGKSARSATRSVVPETRFPDQRQQKSLSYVCSSCPVFTLWRWQRTAHGRCRRASVSCDSCTQLFIRWRLTLPLHVDVLSAYGHACVIETKLQNRALSRGRCCQSAMGHAWSRRRMQHRTRRRIGPRLGPRGFCRCH